jgi:hypothetical protein
MTAVEWLEEQLIKTSIAMKIMLNANNELVEQAKEMEKQKTIDFAYEIADDLACDVLSKKAIEDRYNEFFKSE